MDPAKYVLKEKVPIPQKLEVYLSLIRVVCFVISDIDYIFVGGHLCLCGNMCKT